MENHSIHFHSLICPGSFSWLKMKMEIKTLLLLKSTPVKQQFSLPLFYRGNQKKASHEVLLEKEIIQKKIILLNMKFLKIGNQEKEEENMFSGRS